MMLIKAVLSSFFVIIQYLIFCEILPIIGIRIGRNFIKPKWIERVRMAIETGVVLFFSWWLIKSYHLDVLSSPQNEVLQWMMIITIPTVLFFITEKCVDPALDKMLVSSSMKYKALINDMNLNQSRMMIKVCVLAPIVEEIIVRGILQGELFGNYHFLVAILISSILFAFMHFNWVQFFSSLLPSVIIGLTYNFGSTLATCIMIHALYNALSLAYHFRPLRRKDPV